MKLKWNSPERYIQYRQAMTEKFRKDRQKAQLRKSLLLECPHCDNCGRTLQGQHHELPNYAHVILHARKLSCFDCVHVVRALAAVETVG